MAGQHPIRFLLFATIQSFLQLSLLNRSRTILGVSFAAIVLFSLFGLAQDIISASLRFFQSVALQPMSRLSRSIVALSGIMEVFSSIDLVVRAFKFDLLR